MLSTSASLVALLLLGAPSGPPDPPPDLRPWVEYARRATDTGPACPPGQACVQLRRVEVRGHATSGRITLSTTGNNLGRIPQQVVLLGPSATFSVISTAWRQGRGVVRLDGETWVARWTKEEAEPKAG